VCLCLCYWQGYAGSLYSTVVESAVVFICWPDLFEVKVLCTGGRLVQILNKSPHVPIIHYCFD